MEIEQTLRCETMSIMFLDVKGYSKLGEAQLKKFFSNVLKKVAEILSQYETIDTNSWGDGVVAFYSNPVSGARCALDIRDYFAVQNWKDLELPPLYVRIGLHTGPVWRGYDPIRNREGVVGAQVNLAARIEPVVPEGHIFATDTFVSMLNRGGDQTIVCDKVGSKELAKSWGEEFLFNVRWRKDVEYKLPQASDDSPATIPEMPFPPGLRMTVNWRKRGDIADNEWRSLFAGAKKRIWLLGHSLLRSMAPANSGAAIAERLSANLDVRMVVLDPYDSGNSQLDDIATEIAEPDFRSKIKTTLRYALSCRSGNPLMSIGITHASMHTSIVIVDDRFLVTVYSHNWEMGDAGMTLDLNMANAGEAVICKLFENDFLWHWRQSYPFRDEIRALPRVEWRILNFADKARASIKWYEEPKSVLEPPHLVVINPTYTCRHASRDSLATQDEASITGPHAKRLLCPNCMYGDLLNSQKRQDMDIDSFRDLCIDLSEMGVGIIEISGGGEPLHHVRAEELFTCIDRMRKTGDLRSEVGLLSNVEALVGLGFAPEILLQSMKYVRWSWPENAELQPTLRARYLQALKNFTAAKTAACSSTRVGVKMLLTSRSAEDLPKQGNLIRELFETGIDHVKIRTIRSSIPENRPGRDTLRHAEDYFSELAFELYEDGLIRDERNLEVDLRARKVHSGYQCRISTLFSVIEPSGDVRMCWNDLRSNPRVIGNVFNGGFSKIWGTERHRHICRTMDPHIVCNSATGCDCRFVGYQETVQRFVNWEDPYQSKNSSFILKDQFL